MKNFLSKIFCFFLLLLIPVAVIYISYSKSKEDFVLVYKDKCCMLKDVQDPRIIFVSGSNLAFGLDSKRISDSLHVNVVNTGLSISIGLRYMIDDVSQYVREGDVVVIAPEYQHFYNFPYGDSSGILTRVVQLSSWKNVKILNMPQIVNVVKGFGEISKSKIHSMLHPHSSTSIEWRPKDCVYNQYGDEVSHWKYGTIDMTPEASVASPFDADFARYFINKIDLISEKAIVVIIPPAMTDEAGYEELGSCPEEVANFLKNNGHPFLVNPIEHVLSQKYRFNSAYHLTKGGVDLFTGKVIEELRPYIESRGK